MEDIPKNDLHSYTYNDRIEHTFDEVKLTIECYFIIGRFLYGSNEGFYGVCTN